MDESTLAMMLSRAPEEEDERASARRAAAVLAALGEYPGLCAMRLWEGDGKISAVGLGPEDLLGLLRAQPPAVGRDGRPRPERGVTLTFVAGAEPPRLATVIHLTLGDRQIGDRVRVTLDGLDPESASALFGECLRAFSPRFGCLGCPYGDRLREDGDRPLEDEMLHWRTYYGPGGREGAVDLDAARRLEGVSVRPLHEGSEVALGGRWESPAKLLELRRIAEPQVLRPGAERYTASTPEELGITMPPGDPDMIREHARAMESAAEAFADLADRVSDPAAVATEEWLRLSMRLAVAERELAAAAAGSEHAYGPKLANAFVAMIERMIPSVRQARQTAERCLAVARSREA